MDTGFVWVRPLTDDDEPLPLPLTDQLAAARHEAGDRNRKINVADRAAGIFHPCDAAEAGSFLHALFEHVSRRLRAEPRLSCRHVGELRPRNLFVGSALVESCDRPACVEGLAAVRVVWHLDEDCALCGVVGAEAVDISAAVPDGRLVAAVCASHIA